MRHSMFQLCHHDAFGTFFMIRNTVKYQFIIYFQWLSTLNALRHQKLHMEVSRLIVNNLTKRFYGKSIRH